MGLNEAERIKEQQRSLRLQILRYAGLAGIAVAVLIGIVLLVMRLTATTKEEFLASGDEFAGRGHYPEAVIEYRNAVNLDNTYGPAHAALASAYLHEGELAKAVTESVSAADLQPDSLDAQLDAATLLLRAGRFEEALARADNALGLNANSVEAHLARASAFARMVDANDGIFEIVPPVGSDLSGFPQYRMLAALPADPNLVEAEAGFLRAAALAPASVDPLHALAAFYSKTGRLAYAETPLRRAVAVDPESLIGHRRLAAYLVQTGRPGEAEALLKRFVDGRTDVPPLVLLADYYISHGQTVEARAVLGPLARRNDMPATIRLARLDFAPGTSGAERAHEALEKVSRSDPKNVDALLLRASFMLIEGDLVHAVLMAERAVAAAPGAADAHSMLAEAYARSGDLASAIAAWQRALSVNPALVGARLRLARLYLQTRNVEMAVRLADDAVRTSPASVAARLVRAEANTAHAAFPAAASDLALLTRNLPDLVAAHALLGELELKQRRLPAARGAFERVLQLEPSSFDALRGLAAIDVMEQRTDHALSLVNARLATAPDDAAALMLAATLHEATGDRARQESALVRVVQIAPGNLQAFRSLTALYVEQKKLDDARARFEELAHGPAPTGAQTMLGFIYEVQKMPAEARYAYEKAVGITSAAAVAANNLAWLYLQGAGTVENALQLAQTAIRAQPDSPAFNDTLGWVYVRLRRPDAAIEPLQVSVRAEPDDPQYHYHLGVAYMDSGEKQKATDAFEEALRLHPGYANAERALKTLTAAARAPG